MNKTYDRVYENTKFEITAKNDHGNFFMIEIEVEESRYFIEFKDYDRFESECKKYGLEIKEPEKEA